VFEFILKYGAFPSAALEKNVMTKYWKNIGLKRVFIFYTLANTPILSKIKRKTMTMQHHYKYSSGKETHN